MNGPRKTPWWVFGIIAGMAALEPIMHCWLRHGLPEHLAHTGFHIGDTPFFLTAMNIFQNGFLSPYAIPESPHGMHSMAYFALPHHWLYGGLGLVARLFHADPFVALGVANGVCGALFFWAVWRFLCAASPARAKTAFLLFSFPGGLGGILFAAVSLGCWLGAAFPVCTPAGFEAFFHRYARYELIEGPFIAPWLILPRLYYTLPLALGFFALTRLLRRTAEAPPRGGVDVSGMLLIFLAAYFNARVGMMFGAAAVCLLYTLRAVPLRARMQMGCAFLLPIMLAAGLVSFQFQWNPTGAANVSMLLRRSAWFGSLASALFWHMLCLPAGLRPALRGLPKLGYAAAFAAMGYIACFGLLYLAHQLYYGNLTRGGDTAAAVAVSDLALAGALAGLAYGFWRKRTPREENTHNGWMALWFLSFLWVSIAAFGQGWFMRFMPERFMVLLGVPIALLTAEGLAQIRAQGKPRLARVLLGVLLGCGLCSLAVSAVFFQLPVEQPACGGVFRWTHSEIMHPADASILAVLDAGTVLTPASGPPFMGDVAVCANPRLRTVFGQPSLEFSGALMGPLAGEVQRFFAPDTPDSARRAFIQRYQVDYVWCPATHPVDPEALAQLRRAAWLESLHQEANAGAFRVRGENLHE